MLEIDLSLFANSQKIQVEGVRETFSFLLPLMLCAWSDARSIATSWVPRWRLISWVAAIMLRTTTVLHFALFGPQYFAFGARTSCDVVLYCFSTYGPLPAPAEAAELNHCSALSVLSASAASVPPCALTSFELTIPSDVFARIAGRAVFGVFDLRTTPYFPFAATLTSASRKAGLPFRLISWLYENTTSA